MDQSVLPFCHDAVPPADEGRGREQTSTDPLFSWLKLEPKPAGQQAQVFSHPSFT